MQEPVQLELAPDYFQVIIPPSMADGIGPLAT